MNPQMEEEEGMAERERKRRETRTTEVCALVTQSRLDGERAGLWGIKRQKRTLMYGKRK